MRDKLIALLDDIDEDIVSYDGSNLFDAGLLDSFAVIEIVGEMEKIFSIEIKSEDVIEKNFKTVENMFALLKRVMGMEKSTNS